ncbi:odorant receptor 83a-like [Diprion similis]|uniref:odorant receptor 83a-like n=1 Tax=Diprion similis TaxID=362088 RepID=UPI001EF7D54D|nr:odorant receptor 83a-like [Diprion similis]XP_046736958.1 odorant receptor 83a-like [Diprion similis]
MEAFIEMEGSHLGGRYDIRKAMEAGRKKSEKLDVSFGQYFDHTKRLLKLFRMWELDASSPKWQSMLIVTSTAMFLTCNFMIGFSEMMKLRTAPDLANAVSCASSLWLHLIGFVKWVYLAWRVRDVIQLVGQLEDCYYLSLEISETDEDYSQLQNQMNAARKSSVRFSYVWIIGVTYGIIHWCLNPLFFKWRLSRIDVSLAMSDRTLPYKSWSPWDLTRVEVYGYVYLIQVLGSLASSIGSIAYDIFFLTLVMMICAQLSYLNYSLVDKSHGCPTTTSSEKKTLTFAFIRNKLIRSKNHHDAILAFLTSLQNITSPVMFLQCIGTIGILCLVSFEVMTLKLKGDIANVIRVWSMVEYIGSCFAQLFCFCYYADQMTTLGLKVSDSTYSSGWESMTIDEQDSASYRKSIGFLVREIMVRAQRHVQLTGGPFYVLSLRTYRAVVSAAFSYSAVLREVGAE